MRLRHRWAIVLAAGLLVAGACGAPTRPTSTVTGGQPLSPAREAAISYYSQPVTLSVTPGLMTGGGSLTSVVDVASDSAFGSIVMTRPVPATTTGTATVTLDRLSASATYYWRVRTTGGTNSSVTSSTSSFSVGPELVIQAPIPIQPRADTFPGKRPTFSVQNAAHAGPPATLTYTFDVAADAGFATRLASGTVSEGQGHTSLTLDVNLDPGTTYFWRSRARDESTGVTGPDSAPQVFTTVFPDDGHYRYTLVVRTPTWCLTHFSGQSPCTTPDRWYQSDFGFDVSLVVEGDHLRFALPRIEGALYNEGALVFEAERTADRLTGRIAGTTWNATPGSEATTVSVSGPLTGSGNNAGRFDGTIGGRIALWRFGFPCDKYETCATSDIRWTLLPK